MVVCLKNCLQKKIPFSFDHRASHFPFASIALASLIGIHRGLSYHQKLFGKVISINYSKRERERERERETGQKSERKRNAIRCLYLKKLFSLALPPPTHRSTKYDKPMCSTLGKVFSLNICSVELIYSKHFNIFRSGEVILNTSHR